MVIEDMNERFQTLNQANQQISQALEMSYLEGLHETLQNIQLGSVQQIDGEPDDETSAQLEALYQTEDWSALSRDEMRQLIQLLILEGDRIDQLPPNYQMTPAAIALLIGHLASKVTGVNEPHSHGVLMDRPRHLVDLMFGMGNLWSIVCDELSKGGYLVTGEGVDNDDLMLAIGEQAMALEGLTPTLYLGDALQQLYVHPADVIVSDLPVGYYPLNDQSKHFLSDTHDLTKQHMSYAHFLLIEQAFHYLKPAGWGLYLVPSSLFQMTGFERLLKAIQQEGYLQAFLTLPSTLFRNESLQKAILIVQKKGDDAKQSEHVMLGNLPDLKDKRNMQQFIAQFDAWVEEFKA
ncbi:MAG: class I SAM-dependent methyltransferase [Aerococcus sp.]|nr:class I SAM-dependent methyltransferase [Aerococcus sp.]